MSKLFLRLMVVIAVVLLSVGITMLILHKPNYNQTVYKSWQSSIQDSRYDLNEKINTNINSNVASYNGHSLKELEQKVENISIISQNIDNYITYLLNYAKFSESVEEKDAKKLKKSLNKYYDLRLSDNGTGYWVDYYYSYVQDQSFDASNLTVYNSIVNTICEKWILQSKQGASLIAELENYVAKYVFDGEIQTSIKNVLLSFTAQFASVYVNSENINEFEANHTSEFNNLQLNVETKLTSSNLTYTPNDISLVKNYSSLTKEEISEFIKSINKSDYIQQLANQENVNQAKVDALNVLITYLGV